MVGVWLQHMMQRMPGLVCHDLPRAGRLEEVDGRLAGPAVWCDAKDQPAIPDDVARVESDEGVGIDFEAAVVSTPVTRTPGQVATGPGLGGVSGCMGRL